MSNRRNLTKVQIGDNVKSGLCKTVKWGGEKSFVLKVPACTETIALRDFLWRHEGPAGTEYFAPGIAQPVAWQWTLALGKWARLWRVKSPELG